jgi:L-lysine exporter family protein LysE/ArgO
MDMVLRNVLLGISLAAPIGPAGVAVIQNGLRQGFRRAFLTGLGVTLADATYLLVVFFGVSSLMADRPVRLGIWLLGAGALGYLGLRSVLDARREIGLERSMPVTARNPLLVGYLVNVSNPVAVVWWVGVFGSLLAESGVTTARLSALAVSSSILLGILAWHSAVSLLTHWGGRFVSGRSARLVSLAAGLALLAFAARFAFAAYRTLSAA